MFVALPKIPTFPTQTTELQGKQKPPEILQKCAKYRDWEISQPKFEKYDKYREQSFENVTNLETKVWKM